MLSAAADLPPPPRNLERLEKEKLEECLALAAPCCCPTGILEEEEGIIGGGVLATARVAAITPRAIGPGRGGGGGGGGGAERPPAVDPCESATGTPTSLPTAMKKILRL